MHCKRSRILSPAAPYPLDHRPHREKEIVSFHQSGYRRFTRKPSPEYCSNTVIESFAYGKPVIGAEIGGIPEQVIHGKNGYLHPPGDEQKLGELINSLYCNEELIRKMGMEARRTVETKYSGERHYRRLMEVYRRLIAEKTGATAGN